MVKPHCAVSAVTTRRHALLPLLADWRHHTPYSGTAWLLSRRAAT
ncbi:MAG: hypothetical protein R3E52_08750 [Burkholderiaceae bacterium]